MSGLYFVSYYFTWIETMLRNELGLADPTSSVHLEVGIGVGSIGFVSWCTETVVAWELLVAGLGHEIGISVT